MAKTYSEVINSAYTVGNIMDWTNALTRLSGVPLDISELYNSYDKAVVYAASNPVAYEGQVITVIENNDATVYVITPNSQGAHTITDGDDAGEYQVYLKEVGSATNGDNTSITLEDGVLSIKGFEAAAIDTLPQKQPDGTIKWIAIDTIVDGDGNTKAEVVAAEGSAVTVSKTHIAETDTYTYTLDVTIPDIPEYTVTKVESESSITYTVTKDNEQVGEAIVVPKAYDDTALANRVSGLESSSADYASRIEAIELFFEDATRDTTDEETGTIQNALDTLVELQNYITSDGEAATALTNKVTAIETAVNTLTGDGEGSVTKTVTDAIAAQAQTDASTYATKDALAAVKATADAAAVKTTVDEALADKADKADLDNYYVKDDVYTKDAVDTLLAGIKGEYGETADSVSAALSAHKTESDNKFSAIEEDVEANTNAIADINNAETGILAQANTNAQTKVDALANGAVKDNTAAISALQTKADNNTTSIEGLNTRIGTLEGTDTKLSNDIATEKGRVDTLVGTVATHGTDIALLKDKDTTLESKIDANTAKFADYSTTTEVDTKIENAVNAIDYTTINQAITKNAEDISNEVTRATTRENEIAALVEDNTTAIGENTSEIARVNAVLTAAIENEDDTALNSIKELAAWISEHDTEVLPIVNSNTTAIEKLNANANTVGSVANTVATAIAKIPLATASVAGLVKSSDEINVDANGAMSLGVVSTDKLINGSATLVLNGGDSRVQITE